MELLARPETCPLTATRSVLRNLDTNERLYTNTLSLYMGFPPTIPTAAHGECVNGAEWAKFRPSNPLLQCLCSFVDTDVFIRAGPLKNAS